MTDFSVSTAAELNAALVIAASNGVADVITLTANISAGAGSFTNGYLAYVNLAETQSLTIVGGGFSLDANAYGRGLFVSAGDNVIIQNLTIREGAAAGNGGGSGNALAGGSTFGAGIVNNGTLTLQDVTVTANVASGGGGGGGAVNGTVGGGGGGGGGVNGIGGGSGGTAGAGGGQYNGVAGGAGQGGRGGGYQAPSGNMGGRGGSTAGGAGGIGTYGYSSGGAGGSANNGGGGMIGGGGGGAGWDGNGGIGGAAVGGIYNTGTMNIIGTSIISNNLGAGGGGGGGGGAGNHAGVGGLGVGAIWNQGGNLNITASNFSALTGNAGASGLLGAVVNGGSNAGFVSPTSVNNIYNNAGTLNTSYNTAPTVPATATTVAAVEQTAATLLGAVTVSDAELGALNGGNGNYAGASFTVQRGVANTADTFSFASGGLFTVSGGNLQSGGLTFATFTSSGGVLTINFTSSATAATTALVSDVVQHISYASTSDAPPASMTLNYVLNDGSAQGSGAVTVNITAVNDAHTGGASISGTQAENGVLTAVSTIVDADGLGALHYQWQRDSGSGFINVGTDQSTYTLGDGDVGGVVRVVTYYTDAGGTVESATSSPTTAIGAVNDAPTGGATITGTATEDEVLTADTSTLADADGVGSLHYDWQRDTGSGFVSIGAEDQATYALGDADVGYTVRAVVTYIDGQGFTNAVTSDPTSQIVGINDLHTGGASVSGTQAEDNVLTAVSTLTDADGLGALHYQWQRDSGGGFVNVGVDQSTYTLGDDDIGGAVRVVIYYTDAGGTVESATSTATGVIAATNDAAAGGVSISGTATEDEVLTADTSTLSDSDGLGTLHYDWQRDTGSGFVSIGAADQATYALGDGDTGAVVRVVVSYTDGQGFSNVVTSGATGIIANVDDAGTANDDAVAATESNAQTGNVFLDNGSGADVDVDSALTVAKVNGSAASVGTVITLASGAHLTLLANGDFTYDPNGAFDALPGPASGAANTTATDSFTYSLADGSTATVTITVNGQDSSDDVLAGTSGDDTLDGGAGASTMTGGDGDDTYIVDNAGDQVVESPKGGSDTVRSSITYTLGASVENLVLTGSADIDGTGNALNNALTGNAGNNVLNGGAGADTLSGGAGNDTYYVDNAGDVVIEGLRGGGVDLVLSSVTFNGNVAGNVGLENVTLVGTRAVNARGNDLANTIIGNDANNYLTGDGGADTLIGGLGNDTYGVDNRSDVIVEAANAGTDYVRSTVSWTLGADLENLNLYGHADIFAIGNELKNVIVGNDGDNIIAGKGGADTLTGGAGADTFDYNAVNESSYSAYDRITDLTNADKIDLSGIDANTGLAGNQAFAKVNAFTHHAGEITLTYDAAKDFTVLSADVNGDGVADMRIVLNGDHHAFTNFVF